MRRRTFFVTILVTLVALVALPAAASAVILPWCAGPVVTDCIVAADHNGASIADGDPTYNVQFSVSTTPGPTQLYNLQVTKIGDTYNLPAELFTVTVNTAATVPYQTFNRGRNVVVTRGGTASSNVVTVAMNPVRMAYTNSGCGGTGTCPLSADFLAPGYWESWIDDAGFADPGAYRDSLRGFDFSTNADWASSPPQLDFATNTILIDVANSHFEPDAATPVFGRAEFFMPFTMLARLYNVDDPASLTASSFAVTTGGGGPTTTVTALPSSVAVVIDNLSFSRHALRVAGRTNPTRPAGLRAKRTRPSRGLVRTSGSTSRGSRVRGYVARCVNRQGHVVTGSTDDHTGGALISVRGLRVGRRYRCVVRARSAAGKSAASYVTIPRYPS